MTRNNASQNGLRKYLPVVLFIVGFGMLLFTRRSDFFPTIPIVMVIAPIFILRFIRTQPAKRGILLTLLGFILSMNLALWGIYKLDNIALMLVINITMSTVIALMYFIPYFLDRLIYPRFNGLGIISVLIFPILTTAIMFIFSLEGPIDGATAKTIYVFGNEWFLQIASIVGIWGFVFVYSCFASVINYSWEIAAEIDYSWKDTFDLKKIRKFTITSASILLIILIIGIQIFGAIKTSTIMTPESETVKTAAIVLIPEDGEVVSTADIWEEKQTSPYNDTMNRIENLTKEAASNGAKIVTFQEYAMVINEEDQSRLIEDYKHIALESNVYFSITYAYFSEKEKGENKHLLIDNNGEILINYTKRYLWGFGDMGENGVYIKGEEIIQTADTPYGRIGVTICKDMNYPSYIKQAGEKDVDIMLGPSYDFPKSEGPSYTGRAIENGFSFIRPTYNGVSFAEDYNGNILNEMDSDETDTGIMYTDVRVEGIDTVYTTIGDSFALFCILGSIGSGVFAIIRRIRAKSK